MRRSPSTPVRRHTARAAGVALRRTLTVRLRAPPGHPHPVGLAPHRASGRIVIRRCVRPRSGESGSAHSVENRVTGPVALRIAESFRRRVSSAEPKAQPRSGRRALRRARRSPRTRVREPPRRKLRDAGARALRGGGGRGRAARSASRAAVTRPRSRASSRAGHAPGRLDASPRLLPQTSGLTMRERNPSSSRQSSRVRTRRSRKNFPPKRSSQSARAREPISRIMAPPFPTRIPFCPSRST